MIKFPAALLLLIHFSAWSQNTLNHDIRDREENFQFLSREVLLGENDSIKSASSYLLLAELQSFLLLSESGNYSFDSLKYLSVVKSPDRKFRIFTWYMIHDDSEHTYFGLIQDLRNKKSPKVAILTDRSDSLTGAAHLNLTNNNWFGALYYEMIPGNKKGGDYLLLGWDGHNNSINRKVIERVTFGARGDARFGGSFRLDKKPVKRVIFEYSEQASMSLRYDRSKGMIIFDHLSPSASGLKDNPEFYGPDFSYDALVFNKGKWEYIRDIDARNSVSNKKYYEPKEKEK